MRFQITKTSKDQKQPCDGAIFEETDYVDGWFIEINSLEELLGLKKRYGELILTTDYGNIETIEIYDDLRE